MPEPRATRATRDTRPHEPHEPHETHEPHELFRRAREPQRVEAVWRAVDGLMHRSKWQSRSGIWEKSNSERRGKREERREKRDGSVPEGRDGREKGRALGETREERKEKREDPCRNNEQLNCNCTATGFALSRVEQQREKREERREKRSQKRPPEIPKLTDSRFCWSRKGSKQLGATSMA